MRDPKDIVSEMMKNDSFSQWLGIHVISVAKGTAKISMTVRDEMVNGFGVVHGGITYCLADSCLAFAVNGNGVKSMSIETSISHLNTVHPGDHLTAIAKEINLSNKIGVYSIDVFNQENKLVAQFKGTCYRSSKEW